MKKLTYRYFICLIAGLLTVGSAQAGWKSFRGGDNKLAGIYVLAQNNRGLAIYYSCGFESGPECRMDMQLKLPCTSEPNKYTVPIQYGEQNTTAIIECKGRGGSSKEDGRMFSVWLPRQPKVQYFKARVQYFYDWTVTLPNQGDGAVPKFTDKKLVFTFKANGGQQRYFFSTKGWEKAMGKFHQKWAMKYKNEK